RRTFSVDGQGRPLELTQVIPSRSNIAHEIAQRARRLYEGPPPLRTPATTIPEGKRNEEWHEARALSEKPPLGIRQFMQPLFPIGEALRIEGLRPLAEGSGQLRAAQPRLPRGNRVNPFEDRIR